MITDPSVNLLPDESDRWLVAHPSGVVGGFRKTAARLTEDGVRVGHGFHASFQRRALSKQKRFMLT